MKSRQETNTKSLISQDAWACGPSMPGNLFGSWIELIESYILGALDLWHVDWTDYLHGRPNEAMTLYSDVFDLHTLDKMCV